MHGTCHKKSHKKIMLHVSIKRKAKVPRNDTSHMSVAGSISCNYTRPAKVSGKVMINLRSIRCLMLQVPIYAYVDVAWAG